MQAFRVQAKDLGLRQIREQNTKPDVPGIASTDQAVEKPQARQVVDSQQSLEIAQTLIHSSVRDIMLWKRK